MNQTNKVVLITGASKRIGREISKTLHQNGWNIIIHYFNSEIDAESLAEELNASRENSTITLQADLRNTTKLPKLIEQSAKPWSGLDCIVHNASSFYSTPVHTATEKDWDELMGTNLKPAFFLAQAAQSLLRKRQGCIINIVDIHAIRPLKAYSIYSVAKSGLAMLTRTLAKELGPEIRVNGVAPGSILWPENTPDKQTQNQIIKNTALKKQGSPSDIAKCVLFLIKDANYITGQVINVDGGRTLYN